MSRNLRTTVPVHPCTLMPKVVPIDRLNKKDSELKLRQKENYDLRHKAQELTPLNSGDKVYVPQLDTTATVDKELPDRSYIVSTPNMQFRRNRRHLNSLPKQ